jgi:hypothetical protein
MEGKKLERRMDGRKKSEWINGLMVDWRPAGWMD